MAKGRLVLHPVLRHPRSRFIFLIFLFISLISGAMIWIKFETILHQAGINLRYGPPTKNILLETLVSPFVRGGIIFCTSIIAAGITAGYVVGPVKRIEQWLLDLEAGQTLKPLRVRDGDKFTKLVSLINRLQVPR